MLEESTEAVVIRAKAEVDAPALREFKEILRTSIDNDREVFKEADSTYRDFRVLKETLRSDEFNRVKMANDDLREITDYLVKSEKYSGAFQDWIRSRRGEWELKAFPQNAHRLYALGSRKFRNT